MGLDMWAVACTGTKESDNDIQLGQWRKHNRLHGWFEQLWIDLGRPNEDGSVPSTFNCIPLTLNEGALLELQDSIIKRGLPDTQGFFFGHDSYDYDTEEVTAQDQYDLEFIDKALKAIKDGYTVIYNSWW